jgi:hypothetical protein
MWIHLGTQTKQEGRSNRGNRREWERLSPPGKEHLFVIRFCFSFVLFPCFVLPLGSFFYVNIHSPSISLSSELSFNNKLTVAFLPAHSSSLVCTPYHASFDTKGNDCSSPIGRSTSVIQFVVHLMTLSETQTRVSNDRRLMNNELERIWKETVVA